MSPFSLIDVARLSKRAYVKPTYGTPTARDISDVVTFDAFGETNELRTKMTAVIGTMFAVLLLMIAAIAAVCFLLD